MIYDKASLAQIPSGVGVNTLFSVVPNTSTGDFAYTGSTNGTRVNKDGLIETIAANVPRLNYNFINGVVQPDPHLLLEPSRTNYATNNSSMDTYGTVSGSSPSPTLTADYTTAPDGSNTATRLQTTVTGSNYSLISFPNTTLGNGTYYVSVYAKSNTGSNQTISFYGAGSTTQAHTVTPEWTRIIVEATRGSGETKYAFLGTWASSHGTDTSIDISVWGAQTEIDSSYATSLIPTTTVVTRAVDNAQIASGAEDIIGSQNEGTLFIDLEIPYDTTSSDYFQFSISDQNALDNRVFINFRSGEAQFQVFSGNPTVGVGFCNTPTPKNIRLKIAGSYETDNFVLFKDGFLADDIDTGGTVNFTTQMESIRYADQGNGLKFQAKVYQTMFFKEALTQDELETLTSYKSFNEMATQQLYIIE